MCNFQILEFEASPFQLPAGCVPQMGHEMRAEHCSPFHYFDYQISNCIVEITRAKLQPPRCSTRRARKRESPGERDIGMGLEKEVDVESRLQRMDEIMDRESTNETITEWSRFYSI
ncbi:hypothetical protein WR25_20322 [Diploscapter pachys]|uniref:Uncharacterized protein n=1 Tax=Diploscapter pachys TaxID=2018661 RepID=A0A2A2L6W3_9BILA|nr:hypothetical protein WR25_20322 [Diploscapter pachys]